MRSGTLKAESSKMGIPCEVAGCDGEAITVWRDDEGDVFRACEDCSGWFQSHDWDYVNRV